MPGYTRDPGVCGGSWYAFLYPSPPPPPPHLPEDPGNLYQANPRNRAPQGPRSLEFRRGEGYSKRPWRWGTIRGHDFAQNLDYIGPPTQLDSWAGVSQLHLDITDI